MDSETRLVVFTLATHRYAIELERIQRVVRVVAVTPLPRAPANVLGIIDFGGTVLPVINLRERFNLQARSIRLSDHLIIASTGRRIVALLVDEATGVIKISPEEIAPGDGILPRLEFIDGAVKLDDGLILIQDLDRLLSLEEEALIDQALSEQAAHNTATDSAKVVPQS